MGPGDGEITIKTINVETIVKGLEACPTSIMSHGHTYLLPILYGLPKGIAREMEKLMAKFLWKGSEDGFKHRLVKWADVCLPKKNGGLGVRGIKAFNSALLLKWCWRLNTCRDTPWATLVTMKLGISDSDWAFGWHPARQISKLWKRIYRLYEEFRKHIRILVGNGEKTHFWTDVWIEDTSLRIAYPKLYRIARSPEINIHDLMDGGSAHTINWTRIFRRNLKDEEALELSQLDKKIQEFYFSPLLQDELVWAANPEGNFSVSSAYNVALPQNLASHPASISWCLHGPPKMKFFLWSALWGKILTRDNLRKRGMSPPTLNCPLCNEVTETVDHILVHCNYTWIVWQFFFNLFTLSITLPQSLTKLIIVARHCVMAEKGKRMMDTSHHHTLWSMGREKYQDFSREV